MLTKTQTITVSGTSKTEAGEVIGYFTGNIGQDGSVSTNSAIRDRTLYDENKSTFRADRDEFTDYMDSLVDGFSGIAEEDAEWTLQ